MSSRNFQGHQQVVTLIVKGSHPLSPGSCGSYFGRHFGCQVLSGVVTLVITEDFPHHQLGSLVVIPIPRAEVILCPVAINFTLY
jgi:hypothetical protein